MPPRRTSSKLHGVSTDLEEKVGRRLLLWEPIISKQLFYYQGIFAAGPTQTTCPGAGRKAGGTGMPLWAPVPPAHTPSAPDPTSLNFTPQTRPFPAGQASVGNELRHPTLQKEDCCSQQRADFLPWQRGRGRGVARTALRPLKAGTLSSSPGQPRQPRQPRQPCQAGTASHARPALPAKPTWKETRCFFFPPHTPPPPLLSVDWVHTRALKCKQEICFSQSHSENIHLPQRGQPPDLVEGGGSGDGK